MVARKTSMALDGICTWVGAMNDYHKASYIPQNFNQNEDLNMQ